MCRGKSVKRVDFIVMMLASQLAGLGFMAGFAYALAMGIEKGKWGFMWVFAVIMAFGGTALFVVVRKAWKMLSVVPAESEEKVG